MAWLLVREDLVFRLRVLREMREKGVNPYPPTYRLTHTIPEIRRRNIPRVVDEGDISTAGRVMGIRRHGRALFIDLVDEAEKLQLYARVNELGEEGFRRVKRWINKGDFIGVKGPLFYTETGELTLLVKEYTILAKSLLEPPSQWYGLRDVEERYRRRYLDILMNKEVRQILLLRSRITSEIRRFLESRGFIEFETPILQPLYGGAAAKPFKTYINAINEEWFLRISDELYLKRLIIAGFNKVYEIGKDFRNEDIDATHNPELTMLEAYQAYADYNDMMELAESMITHVVERLLGGLKVKHGDVELDFTPPWKRIRLIDALGEYGGYDVEKMTDEDIVLALEKHNIPVKAPINRGLAIAELFEKVVGPQLQNPTLVLDYPRETTPLCKPHRDDDRLIERFELYIRGIEILNAYTELNDPILQHRFFMEEMERHRVDIELAHRYDGDFIEALMHGMPPTGGLGMGLDRLTMVITGQQSIKEVIFYPIQRRLHVGNPFNGIDLNSLLSRP